MGAVSAVPASAAPASAMADTSFRRSLGDSRGDVSHTVRVQGPPGAPCCLMINGVSDTLDLWLGLDTRLADSGLRVVTVDGRDMGTSSKFPIFSPDGSRPSGAMTRASAVTDDEHGPAAREFYGQELMKAGQGQAHAWAYSLADLAEDCIAVLDHLQIERAHLLGMSMGGAVAQILAVQQAERFHTLTAMSTAANVCQWQARAVELHPEVYGKLFAHAQPDRSMDLCAFLENRRGMAGIFGLEGRELQKYEEALAADFERGGVDWLGLGSMRQSLACHRSNNTQDPEAHQSALRALQMPCLVTHGRRDKLMPLEAGSELASLIPGCKMYAYEGGHSLPDAAFDAVADAMLAHMRGT